MDYNKNGQNQQNKNEENNVPYNYGKARKEEGVGCNPTLASGCLISIIIVALLLFLIGYIGPWIFRFLFPFI